MVILHCQGQKHVAKELKIHIVAIFLCCVLNLQAQEVGTPWMYYPNPDTCSSVWFRHTYISSRKPLSAFLAVAANGNIEVFFNDVPLSPSFYHDGDNENSFFTFNVGKYLRRDSNTIAIHCLPSQKPTTRKGVSVCFFGRKRNGQTFSYFGNENWLCRLEDPEAANKYSVNNDYACWVSAMASLEQPIERQKSQKPSISSTFSTQIVIPKYFDVDDNGVEYEFGFGFYGFVRLTLRGATAGERICIGDTPFICSGKTDEQIFTRVFPAYYRRVRISGDDHFDPIQIQRVEGINLSYFPNSNCYYFTDL